MGPGQVSGDVNLRHYLRLLWRRKAVIAASVAVMVGTSLLVSLLQTPVYAASAQVLVDSRNEEVLLDSESSATRSDPGRVVETEIQVVESAPVKEAVRRQLGSAPGVSVRTVGDTDVMAVVARSADPKRAAAVANAYAKAYVDFRRQQAVGGLLAAGEQIQAKVADIQAQIDAIDAGVRRLPPLEQATAWGHVAPQKEALAEQQAAFKERLHEIQVQAALTTGQAQLVAESGVPSRPVGSGPARNGVLALVIGLVLGIGLAFVLEHLDDSIKTKADLNTALDGLPVLGTIPVVGGWKERRNAQVVSITEPVAPASEAYRTLRTSIQFLGLDRSVGTLAVTSPSAQEGKSTTVANLAVALSSAERRVGVVCCDLRRPRLHEFFGLENDVGLTSVLIGEAPLSSAVRKPAGLERLSVLPSGPIPPDPVGLLSSERIAKVLEALRARVDILLLDCPPVLPVTDALIVAARVDAVLLAAHSGRTRRKDVRRAVDLLRQVNASLLGAVLNGVKDEGGYGYAYGYGPRSPAPTRNGHKEAGSAKGAVRAAR